MKTNDDIDATRKEIAKIFITYAFEDFPITNAVELVLQLKDKWERDAVRSALTQLKAPDSLLATCMTHNKCEIDGL